MVKYYVKLKDFKSYKDPMENHLNSVVDSYCQTHTCGYPSPSFSYCPDLIEEVSLVLAKLYLCTHALDPKPFLYSYTLYLFH